VVSQKKKRMVSHERVNEKRALSYKATPSTMKKWPLLIRPPPQQWKSCPFL
jgi:hypothetical protein